MAKKTRAMDTLSNMAVSSKTGWRLGGWCIFWSLIVITGIALGLWQWERATDKQNAIAQREAAPALVNPDTSPSDGAWVTVTGDYLAEHTLFLDNRILGRRLGVAVLTPLRDEQGRLWLMQRGFLETGPSRATPETTTPSGPVEVRGRWQEAGDRGPLFGPNAEQQRLQQIRLEAWSIRGEFAYPGWLHLEEGPGVLDSWWKPNVMPPSRHFGYAVQWWGLALAAAVVMLLGGRRLHRDRRDE